MTHGPCPPLAFRSACQHKVLDAECPSTITLLYHLEPDHIFATIRSIDLEGTWPMSRRIGAMDERGSEITSQQEDIARRRDKFRDQKRLAKMVQWPYPKCVGASPEKIVGGGKQGQEGGRGWPGKSPDRETPVKYLQARDEGNLNDPWPMPTTGIQVRLPA